MAVVFAAGVILASSVVIVFDDIVDAIVCFVVDEAVEDAVSVGSWHMAV